MRTSKSQININQPNRLDRSISRQCIYINQEPQKSKDISTIFHSPLKNGKKNPNYSNPTFMSSNLFYPTEYVKQGITKKNLEYNHNQKSKKQLYDQRIKKEDFFVNLTHQTVNKCREYDRIKSKMGNREQKENLDRSRGRNKIKRTNQDNLNKQLQELINYNETLRSARLTSTKKLDQYPIYIDKNKTKQQSQRYTRNQKQLQEWVTLTNRLQQVKKNALQSQKKKENDAISEAIVKNNQKNNREYRQSRKNAAILANILKEQIALYKEKQACEKRNRNQFCL